MGFGFKRGSGTNVEKGTRERSWREEGYEVLLVSYSHVGLVGFCLVDLGEVVIVVRDSGGTKRRTNFVNRIFFFPRPKATVYYGLSTFSVWGKVVILGDSMIMPICFFPLYPFLITKVPFKFGVQGGMLPPPKKLCVIWGSVVM